MLPHQKLVSGLFSSTKCSKCRASGALEKHPICGRTRHCLDIFSCSTLLHCLDITCAVGRPSSPASLSLRTPYRTSYLILRTPDPLSVTPLLPPPSIFTSTRHPIPSTAKIQFTKVCLARSFIGIFQSILDSRLKRRSKSANCVFPSRDNSN